MLTNPLFLAINHLLTQEPWAKKKLALHAGKTACLQIGGLSVTLTVSADGMVQKPSDNAVKPDVVITLKSSDLPTLLQNRERVASVAQVAGDADFANTLAQLSQTLRWDMEHDLSQWVGDIAAKRLTAGVKSMQHNVQTTQRKFSEQLAEYFLEENPMLVRTQLASEFTDQINTLRDDVERLEKRIARIEKLG